MAIVSDDFEDVFVMNPDGGNLRAFDTGPGEGALDNLLRALPDLLRVVLDPAGGGEELRELLLRDRADGAIVVEDDGPRAGGALIERENVRHMVSPPPAAGRQSTIPPCREDFRARCWPSFSARSF
jgi:DNA-binding transcriptional LysR family regulator